MILGLTGSMGAGKGEVVKILERWGFKYITLSKMVRAEAQRLGIPEEREKLMAVGDQMRAQEGFGVLAKRALETIQKEGGDKWVVDGIRNPAEIDELRKSPDAHIVGLQANQDILVDRIIKRARPSDAKTPEDIIHRIKKEWGDGEPEGGQQVGKCMQKVDRIIVNEGTLEELEKKFEAVYNELSK